MTVTERLGQFRTDQPGCDLVVFGDLSTRLTLCASAAEKKPQELLDAVMTRASELLDGPEARDIAALLGAEARKGLGEAVVFGPGEVQTVMRSRRNRSDMISCRCDEGTDLVSLVREAGKTLQQLGEG